MLSDKVFGDPIEYKREMKYAFELPPMNYQTNKVVVIEPSRSNWKAEINRATFPLVCHRNLNTTRTICEKLPSFSTIEIL